MKEVDQYDTLEIIKIFLNSHDLVQVQKDFNITSLRYVQSLKSLAQVFKSNQTKVTMKCSY